MASFLPVTILSGVIWATYAFVMGRIGGTAFASRPWLGLIMALGLAVGVESDTELVRRIVQWRGRLGVGATKEGPPEPARSILVDQRQFYVVLMSPPSMT